MAFSSQFEIRYKSPAAPVNKSVYIGNISCCGNADFANVNRKAEVSLCVELSVLSLQTAV